MPHPERRRRRRRDENAGYALKSGDHVFVANRRGVVTVVETKTLDIVQACKVPDATIVKRLELSKDGRTLLVVSNAPSLTSYAVRERDRLADARNRAAAEGLAPPGVLTPAGSFANPTSRNQWNAAVFTHDGRRVVGASAGGAHELHCWRVCDDEDEDEEARAIAGGGGNFGSGRFLAATLERVATGTREAKGVAQMAPHPTRPLCVALGANGAMYAWAKAYDENWSAFEPGFVQLDENEVYVEREDEFDEVKRDALDPAGNIAKTLDAPEVVARGAGVEAAAAVMEAEERRREAARIEEEMEAAIKIEEEATPPPQIRNATPAARRRRRRGQKQARRRGRGGDKNDRRAGQPSEQPSGRPSEQPRSPRGSPRSSPGAALGAARTAPALHRRPSDSFVALVAVPAPARADDGGAGRRSRRDPRPEDRDGGGRPGRRDRRSSARLPTVKTGRQARPGRAGPRRGVAARRERTRPRARRAPPRRLERRGGGGGGGGPSLERAAIVRAEEEARARARRPRRSARRRARERRWRTWTCSRPRAGGTSRTRTRGRRRGGDHHAPPPAGRRRAGRARGGDRRGQVQAVVEARRAEAVDGGGGGGGGGMAWTGGGGGGDGGEGGATAGKRKREEEEGADDDDGAEEEERKRRKRRRWKRMKRRRRRRWKRMKRRRRRRIWKRGRGRATIWACWRTLRRTRPSGEATSRLPIRRTRRKTPPTASRWIGDDETDFSDEKMPT